jgi:Spy/CpxP family protein refolding chaperone
MTMIVALLLASAGAIAGEDPAAAAAALAEGSMPGDAAKPLVQGKCMLCHTGDYLTQQRLNEGQWQKTVEKMRKFGAPASDEEAKIISAYLSKYWTQDAPAAKLVRAATPPAPRPAR